MTSSSGYSSITRSVTMSDSLEWEVVGVVDASVAAHMTFDDETVVVEHDDPNQRLICAPKAKDDD